MADEDSGQSSGSPYGATPTAANEPAVQDFSYRNSGAASPGNNTNQEIDVHNFERTNDFMPVHKVEHFRDVFDFLVGITPDRVMNVTGAAAYQVFHDGWFKATDAVRNGAKYALGMTSSEVSGDETEKGQSVDVPPSSPKKGRSV